MKLFLIGFMGSGKTSLGKKLANQMHLHFFDLDREIEKRTGREIRQIFQKDGEVYFRQLESKILNKITDEHQDFVLSCGGGTPCYDNNMKFMNSMGITIFLDVDQKILLGRLRENKDKRPLIAEMENIQLKAFIEDKLIERKKYYIQSEHILKENNPTVKQVLDLLDCNR